MNRRDRIVLTWCNKVRKELHLEPADFIKKGVQCVPEGCPIAKTIGLFAEGYKEYFHVGNMFFDTCPTVHKFVVDFDGGKIPEYEA